MRYPFTRIRIQTNIHNQKKIVNQISPNAILAYCWRKLKIGDPCANHKEKKKIPQSTMRLIPILYLLRIKLLDFFFLFATSRFLQSKGTNKADLIVFFAVVLYVFGSYFNLS